MFLTYTSLHAFFTGITGLIVLVNDYEQNVTGMMLNFPCWVTSLFGAFFIMALFPFGLYHWYLAIRGRTTNEEARGRYRKWGGNPFNLGCKNNCKAYWKKKSSKVLQDSDPSSTEYEIHER